MASRAPAEAAAAPAEAEAAPTPSRHRESLRVRTALKVSSPSDPAEREAEATAKRVMRMPAPTRLGPIVARAPLQPARAPAISVPRPQAPSGAAPPPPKARPPEETSPELEAAIKKEKGGGRPLPADIASFMGPRFKADFSGVRIHTGGRAENLTTRLGARAFAFGRDIFFNAGQFQPATPEGMELIAHELTHTIQQREVVQREVADFAPVEVRESSAPQVQRGIVSEALDWIADKANYIPGFRLFTVVIGLNPVNMSKVDRSGANILRALIEFIPGGGLIVEALENHGVFQKGGKFIEDQFRSLGMVGGMFRDALMEFIDSLGFSDIFRLGSLWGRAKRIFTEPIDKLIEFGKGLVSGVADIVKDAILKPLGRFAASVVPKWDLLVGVFGKNPISGEGTSPAAAIMGSFMELIGQGEIWKNIQQGNAVGQAWSWFKGAMAGALALVTSIPGRVMGVIRSLTIFDIVTVAGAFKKVLSAFGSFAGDFIRWAGGTVLKLLEIILSVVAPTMVPYLKKAGSAFGTIIKAPGTFIGTLVRAGKLGFGQFKKNILKHLTQGLINWLLGSLAGLNLYLPKSFELKEILKFGLSVVGLTWANLRAKLVAATNETVVKTLETGFDLVVTLVREGPAAAWQQLLQSLSNLKSMVTDAIIDYVRQKVIESAIEKLVSMLTPAGAFIQAILAIYRTITFVVNKLSEIGRLVAAFIDSISALAGGVVATAANRIESVLATGLSLAISFLANFAGLGNVSKKVVEIVNKIRKPVDKALDKVVTWVVTKAKQLGKMLIGSSGKPVAPAKGDKPTDGELGKTVTFAAVDGGHRLFVAPSGELMLASKLQKLSAHLTQFRKDAKNLDEPAQSKVLGAIATAHPIAKSIEKDAKEAKKTKIGTDDRDKLDKQIESAEVTLQPLLKTILDELGVKVPDRLDPMTFNFIKGPTCDPGEYKRQLDRQAKQINEWSVEIWLTRRAQFTEFKRAARARGKTGRDITGRDPRSKKAQDQAKVAVFELIVQRLMLPQNATGGVAALIAADSGAQKIVDRIFGKFSESTRRRGMAESTARAAVEPEKKGVSALHEPDQVVGGKYNQIDDVGNSTVNEDIGANWGGRSFHGLARAPLAKNMETQVKSEMRKLKISRAFWRKTKMNVVLT